MNLLIKYYDYESIGGGIPDEVRMKIEDKAMKESSSPSDYEWLQNYYSYGYSLASEKLKEKDEEISRLKEENERLRGGLIRLLGLTENIESMLFHHNHSIDGWHLNGDLEPIMNFVADMDIEAITAAKELLTPSPTTKK